MPSRSAALILVVALLGAAAAQDRGSVSAPAGAFAVRSGRLLASFDLAPAFPAALRRQLESGLTNVIALHVSLLPEGGAEPAAIYGREIEVLYDVWQETYGVTVKDPEHPRGQQLTFPGWPSLQAYLAGAKDLDLAPIASLGVESWVVVARVEVNPVSKELLERTRELIANPHASERVDGGRSVLGAMASYLLRAEPGGSGVHLFRSRPFTVRDGSVR
jgi:hypothetical protein